MNTFFEWLDERSATASLISQLRLLENFYDLPAAEYDKLFEDELQKLIARMPDVAIKNELKALKGFRWAAYIAASVRGSGISDNRAVQESTHDIVSRLLLGKLFSGYDPMQHGPLDRRFKRSVGNAVRNIIEKQSTRRRLLPTVSIGNEFEPGGVTPDEIAARQDRGDEATIEEFRELVRDRLGSLALSVLDLRLDGEGDTKSLVGAQELGMPTSYKIKQTVLAIKRLARDFAAGRDPGFLEMVERAMAEEERTFAKRFAS